MSYALLASAGWALDVAFFVILVLGIALGAYRGFIAGVCKLAGSILAVVVAVLFCVSFANLLEHCFGLTTAIANGLNGALSKKEAFSVVLPYDVPGSELADTLKGLGVESFASVLIGFAFRKVELISAGVTPAIMLSTMLAKWISVIISFLLLILIVKLGALILNKTLSKLADSVAPFRIINQTLGGVLGLFKAVLLILVLLAICSFLPIESLHNFISSATVVGSIFNSTWFANATSYAISGEWFKEFIYDFAI